MKYTVVHEMPTALVERLNTVTFPGKLIKAIVGLILKKIDIHVFVISTYFFFSGRIFHLFDCLYFFFSHECFMCSPRPIITRVTKRHVPLHWNNVFVQWNVYNNQYVIYFIQRHDQESTISLQWTCQGNQWSRSRHTGQVIPRLRWWIIT